jgi:hypothetical protein
MGDLQWVAVYKDESIVTQYNEDGSESKYSDIDRAKLSEFHIIDADTKETVYAVALDPGQRLIFRRRSMMAGNGELLGTIILCGWQQNVKGQNVQSIGWVFPNGSVIQTGRFREDHRIFYGVEFMDFEDETVAE